MYDIHQLQNAHTSIEPLRAVRDLAAGELHHHDGFVRRLAEDGIKQIDASIAASEENAKRAAELAPELERLTAELLRTEAARDAAKRAHYAGAVDRKIALRLRDDFDALDSASRALLAERDARGSEAMALANGVVDRRLKTKIEAAAAWARSVEQAHARQFLTGHPGRASAAELQRSAAQEMALDPSHLPIFAAGWIAQIATVRAEGYDLSGFISTEVRRDERDLDVADLVRACASAFGAVETELARQAERGRAAGAWVSP